MKRGKTKTQNICIQTPLLAVINYIVSSGINNVKSDTLFCDWRNLENEQNKRRNNMDKCLLPKEPITSLRCSFCQLYLSIPPIMIVASNNRMQYCCGRCENLKYSAYGRDLAFESISKYMSFPCIYKGCKENILWGKVLDHERICTYRSVTCPICSPECVVKIQEIEDHFKNKHQANFYRIQFIKTTTLDESGVYLLMSNGQPNFIYYVSYGNLFCVSVFSLSLETRGRITYSFKLGSKTNCLSILQENQKVILFDERKHCYRCLSQKCQKRYHKSSSTKFSPTESQDIFTILLKKGTTIDILGMPTQVVVTVKLGRHDMEQKNLALKNSLECPICQNQMKAPIYMCGTGHSVCKVCKPKLKQCPTCRSEFNNSRNYALEEILETVSE